MEYVTTKHAVERFMEWQRTRQEQTTRETAEKKLIEIAKKGKYIGDRPNETIEVEYEKMFAIISKGGKRVVVITFNGDEIWRRWFKKQKYKPRMLQKRRGASRLTVNY